jgi:hypothetical protein
MGATICIPVTLKVGQLQMAEAVEELLDKNCAILKLQMLNK